MPKQGFSIWIIAGFIMVAIAAFFLPESDAQQEPRDSLIIEGEVRSVTENTFIIDARPEVDQPASLTVTVPETTTWSPADVTSVKDLRLGDPVVVTYYKQGGKNVAMEIVKKEVDSVSFQEPLDPVATEPGTVPLDERIGASEDEADVKIKF